LTINTNIKTGEVRYGPDGQALTRVATIQNQTGQLKLPAGKYAFEIAPGDFGYKPLRNTLSLTKDETIQLALERVVITEKTLSPTWTRAELQEWEMPPGWQADAKRNLLIKGRGVGIPREARNRYYKDFRLETNVRMVNGVGVSFALRARDTENFYLLQLTGEKSEEPFVIRLLVVKNGQPRRLQAIPISRSSAKVMTAGGFFNLSVKMVDYDITVQITDSVTGAPYTLGMLTDADHNFPLGAVGIAAGDNEESVIERFVVCTGKCLNE
jgi:hypothetical protein